MPSTKTKKFGNKKGKKARRENRAMKRSEAKKAKFRLKLPSYERDLTHDESAELFLAFSDSDIEPLPTTLLGLDVYDAPRNVEWENSGDDPKSSNSK